MTSTKGIVRASLVAALASMLMGGGTASAQQSHSPFNSPASIRLQFDSPATATTTRTGTIQVTINITVKSAISTPILCQASVVASDATLATQYIETATATASRGTTTATCTVNVPYQWVLGTGGGYAVWYDVYTTSSNGTSLRSTSRLTVTAGSFPANGQTAPHTFNVTL